MRTLLTILLLGGATLPMVKAQIQLNEVQYLGTDRIEIKNTGQVAVDISNWWLCALLTYEQLNSPSLTVTGSLNIPPGGFVTIQGWPLNDAASDLGLYNSNSFTSPMAMEDFTQWGSGGNGRESVAASKGIWTAGEFVPLVASGSSIEYRGPAVGASEWFPQANPTFGSENGILTTCNGGIISEISGQDTIYYCEAGIGGGTGVTQYDSTGTSGSNFTYVVTDANGIILGLPPGDMVDVTGAGVGTCLVWGLGYDGNLTAAPGDNALTAALSDSCFSLSSNFITLIRDSVAGGSILTTGGEDTVYVCYGAGTPTAFDFEVTNDTGPSFALVVTDANGIILGLPPANTVDFTNAGPGECWVWGLSYSGEILVGVGDNATTATLTDGCYELTSDFVVALRDTISGGLIAEASGQDTLYYCDSGNGGGTGVTQYDSTGVLGPNFTYVVTDANGIILGLPPGDMVDVTSAGVGTCLVWGLSYSGNLTAMVGDDATSAILSDGCYDLSDNFITLIRDSIAGGTILTTNGEDSILVCYAGGTPLAFDFQVDNNSGPNFALVVTDDNGNILGLPPANTVDFTNAGPGECWVWGLSYSGEILVGVGDNATTATLTDGCYELTSDFVVAFRDSIGTPCATTGLEEENFSSSFRLFPNPVQNTLYLTFEEDAIKGPMQVEILDLSGRILQGRTFDATSGNLNISVGTLSQGIYLVEIQNNRRIFRNRFVKN